MEKLYKAKELAEIFGVNIKTIYKMGEKGEIERYRIGKSVRFVMPKSDSEKKKGESAD